MAFTYSADITAFASWSAQLVALFPQILPASLSWISWAVMPSTSLEIAFKFPLHPPSKLTFVMRPSSVFVK